MSCRGNEASAHQANSGNQSQGQAQPSQIWLLKFRVWLRCPSFSGGFHASIQAFCWYNSPVNAQSKSPRIPLIKRIFDLVLMLISSGCFYIDSIYERLGRKSFQFFHIKYINRRFVYTLFLPKSVKIVKTSEIRGKFHYFIAFYIDIKTS